MKIDATNIHYRDLNRLIREAAHQPARRLELHNVFGQRYIGTNLATKTRVDVFGTPGNDLGAFMDGPTIIVHGNAQDGCGNTMNDGRIVVEGRAGDITGLAARGGKIFIRDDVGYRAGIHMKQYDGKRPALVIGGAAQDFLGEYMAGGVILLLGLTDGVHRARYIATGMHGGVIYLRGDVQPHQVAKEAAVTAPEAADHAVIEELTREWAGYFGVEVDPLLAGPWLKIAPLSKRPYGKLYA
jgi:glutamate synthase domain-containing protein 3